MAKPVGTNNAFIKAADMQMDRRSAKKKAGTITRRRMIAWWADVVRHQGRNRPSLFFRAQLSRMNRSWHKNQTDSGILPS